MQFHFNQRKREEEQLKRLDARQVDVDIAALITRECLAVNEEYWRKKLVEAEKALERAKRGARR